MVYRDILGTLLLEYKVQRSSEISVHEQYFKFQITAEAEVQERRF